MSLSENAINVFKRLYFKKDPADDTKLLEDKPEQVFARVALEVSNGNLELEEKFFGMMNENYFRPNTPCMMNVGIQKKPRTAACFVSGMHDDLLSILDTDKEAAIIFASGSGIGANFAVLREKDALLTTGGRSSGPFAFIRKLAGTGEAVKSGGRTRRAAILIMFFDNHPDLLDFIHLKDGADQRTLRSMNLSIAITNDFMNAVEKDLDWDLVGVVDCKVKSTHKARDIFNLIAENAWKSGDPGVWFIDRANQDNGLIGTYGRMISTNPCVTGESLVAVANGRGYVPIKQLAEEGKDVLVHTVDLKTRKPYVKYGRNPRKTGEKAKILKVTFDDGSFLRTTEDHKFINYDGSKVKAKDLKIGQPLLSFIKFQSPNTTRGKMYWNIINRDGVGRAQIPERGLILECLEGNPGEGFVPHHINKDSGEISKEEIIECGKKYINEFGKLPTFNVWDKWSKGKKDICSREAIRKMFGGIVKFNSVLKEVVEVPNHKVVSVEEDGFEDVYNITVDDYHTVAYITNTEAKTRKSKNPKHWGVYTANCGEISGLSYYTCALASINLTKFVSVNFSGETMFNWEKLREIVEYGTIFLDNMIDISGYPTPDYEKMAKDTRPIGLGIMGMADMLSMMGVPYDSQAAFDLCSKIALVMTQTAIETSVSLAAERGAFPAFANNREGMVKVCKNFGISLGATDGLRNSNWTTIAPTGSISISCDCSAGMEPHFGICYTKNVKDTNEKWIFVNSIFRKYYQDQPWYNEAIKKIAENNGSCQKIDCVPDGVKKIWKVAHDIDWKDRILMQSSLQQGISNSISSTINLPETATADDIKAIYKMAWEKGLKGVTVYRDGSLEDQPVEFSNENKKKVKVKKSRPQIRDAKVYTVETGHGSIHITITWDGNGKYIELFTAGGKGGGVNASQLEAIGRLISLSLQADVEIAEIAKQLTGISDNSIAWSKLHPNDKKSIPILSIPDAVGKLLYKFYVKDNCRVLPVATSATISPDETEEEVKGDILICPECNGPAYMSEGCLFCPNCGSRCDK